MSPLATICYASKGLSIGNYWRHTSHLREVVVQAADTLMLVSIVIPVYNSGVLEELTTRIDRVFLGLPEHDYEVIFVDDASPNVTVWPTLRRIAGTNTRVVAIQLSRNFGQQPATLCGLNVCRGQVVITMDDDLQHLPEDIPAFLAAGEYDIVIGQFEQKQHGLIKRVNSALKGIFDTIILGKPRGIRLGPYRMLSRTVVEGILRIHTPHPFIPALMFHISRNVTGVSVSHARRTEGRGGYTLVKQLRLFSNLVVNNSSLVLRVVGYMGVACAVISAIYAGWTVYNWFAYGRAVKGWTSLMTSQLLIGGVLLFGIGVIGEYLIRIVESSEVRPTYFVRQRIGATIDARGAIGDGATQTGSVEMASRVSPMHAESRRDE